jgi:hypothetical protein
LILLEEHVECLLRAECLTQTIEIDLHQIKTQRQGQRQPHHRHGQRGAQRTLAQAQQALPQCPAVRAPPARRRAASRRRLLA